MEIIGLIFAIIPLLFFGTIGMYTEKRHFAQLAEEEKKYSGIMVSDMKRLPPNWQAKDATLVMGSVVIANDYLKSFIAGWINFFGGRVFCYETLLERARREAVLRMTKQAAQNGANAIWNVRISTATISSSKENSRATGVEAIAYGTAMKIK